jgi:AcrR family transcriptional regulator
MSLSIRAVYIAVLIGYSRDMPKLWHRTMDAHRDAVREATVTAAVDLVAERGVRGLTMSELAERTGIGRATLYKYFPDVEAVLLAWHDRLVGRHLASLEAARASDADPQAQLRSLLEAFARMQYDLRHAHATELAAFLHRHEHVAAARRRLRRYLRELLAAGAQAGQIRSDVAPAELADYCMHALAGAAAMRSEAAVGRLVAVTVTGLRPARGGLSPRA